MHNNYEEQCQLGFTDEGANHYDFQESDNHWGEDENHNIYNMIPSHHKSPQLTGKIVQQEQVMRANFEKKVQFGEQLQFGLLNPDQLQFQSEMLMPKPIEFKNVNNARPQTTAKTQKKKAPNQKMGFLEGHIQNMMANKKAKKATQIVSKKEAAPVQNKPLPDFNLDTRPSKYFDANIDPKSKREQERDHKQRNLAKPSKTTATNLNPGSTTLGQPVVDADGSRIEIGYQRANGSIGEKFEIYRSLEGVTGGKAQVGSFSMKKLFPQAEQKKLTSAMSPQQLSSEKKKSGHKNIQIAKSQVAFNQDEYVRLMNNEEMPSQISGSKGANESGILNVIGGGTDADIRLHSLVGQALKQKEAMIKVLEDQLNAERFRREEITNKFRDQLSEFEAERDALERLRKASNQLEKKQTHQSQISLSQHNMTDLDMVPSKESQRSKAKTSSKVSLTYNPGRVKSSIPKLVVVPQPKKEIPSEQSQAKFLENLQVKEIERSIKIQRDEEVAAEVVRKLRDNPNESIHQMQNEVALLNRKVQPLLDRVEQAAKNVKIANSNNPMQKGPLGMLSKMGGRLINFYADDLAELLLNDFLAETALELQEMESKQLKNYSGEEAKIVAESLMKNLVDYQSEEALIAMRWQNPSTGKIMKQPLKGKPNPQPSAIAFNLANNEDLQSIDESMASKKYQNPFQSQGIDPFSMKLKQEQGESLRIQKSGAIEFDNQLLKYEEPKRLHKVSLDKQTQQNIQLYREKYEKYLKMHNNTASKDVWKVYDHIAADIFHELFAQSLTQVQKDMEEYIDKVIVDEFQIGV